MTDFFFDIETTGLDPYQHKLLTIQIKKDNDIAIWKLWDEDNETVVINNFLKYLQRVPKYENIYGFNCLKFDVPFISAKLSIYDMMDRGNYHTLYDKKWIDLLQCLGGNYIGMDKWLHLYRIKRRCSSTGKDVPRLFNEGNFTEIEKHAIDDLNVCEELRIKLGFRRSRDDVKQ